MEFMFEATKEERILFLKDFFNFQKELKTYAKKNEANPGKFSYKYITIEELFELLRPILTKNNLCFWQEPKTDIAENEVSVKTYICHTITGIIVKFDGLACQGGTDAQKRGSAETYSRRYSFVSIFGIGCGGDDDDAQKVSNQNSTVGQTFNYYNKTPDQAHTPEQIKAKIIENIERYPTILDKSIIMAKQLKDKTFYNQVCDLVLSKWNLQVENGKPVPTSGTFEEWKRKFEK